MHSRDCITVHLWTLYLQLVREPYTTQLMALINCPSHKAHCTKEEAKKEDLLENLFLE